MNALQIADLPVSEAEKRDVLLLLGVEPEPVRGMCDCICGCTAAAIGDVDCRLCSADDHVWPEATR